MEKFAKSFRERPKKVGKSHGFKYHQMVSDENKLFAFLISSVFSFKFFLASKYKILFICRGNKHSILEMCHVFNYNFFFFPFKLISEIWKIFIELKFNFTLTSLQIREIEGKRKIKGINLKKGRK